MAARVYTEGYFVDDLNSRRCKVVFYVEYVLVSTSTASLAHRRGSHADGAKDIRSAHILSRYDIGDEKRTGGCVWFEQKDKVVAIIERNKQNGSYGKVRS